jgi:hypothetical protein
MQETAVSEWPGSPDSGADHLAPFHVNAIPAVSTATQNLTVGQETPVTDGPPSSAEFDSTRCGPVHLLPFHWIASPVESTATQNVAVGHEMLVMTDVVP